MIHLDLFSGIGGFSLGLKETFNIEHTYYSEIDKYAIDVYKNNFKNITYVGSVTDIQDLPKINIITFGSPCQDFSMAGKRKGMDGERSSLILEAIRLIKQCKPDFFIWENVKGTFSSNSGSDFTAILQAFINIGGYRLEWQLLNTKWFLPQNRERIYLVGYIGNESGQQVFPITENDKSNTEGIVPALNQGKSDLIVLDKRGNQKKGTEASTLVAGYYKQPSDGDYLKVKSATSDGYEKAEVGDSINYQNLPSKTRRGRVGKGIAQTLDSGGELAVIGHTRDAKGKVTKRNLKQEANTLHSSSGGGGNTDQYILDNKIRRLTPIECERLQGFPDNWTKTGKELGTISDTQRYKMCGNAVTVDVVEAVAKRIKLNVI